MQFSIRRKRGTTPFFRGLHKKQSRRENSTMLSSLQSSFATPQTNLENQIVDEQVRAKATMLLKLNLSPRVSMQKLAVPKFEGSRQSKLSMMSSPKKKIMISDLADKMKKIKSKDIITNKTFQLSNTQTARSSQQKIMFLNSDDQDKPQDPKSSFGKRNPLHFFTLNEYFSLVFSKILNTNSKDKITIMASQISSRYEKFPEVVQQDIADIRKIGQRLKESLSSKQNFVELKPFEALEVNGELARLFFHLTNQISARKYKKMELAKIYKQIQYCSRRLEFHKFTLRICFQLAELYKKQSDEINCHIYYSKALKLAIFMNDRFHEEKAIDGFGLNAFSSHNSAQAYYFHQNLNKLNKVQREIIRQKYSNAEQIDLILREREKSRHKQKDQQRHKQKQKQRTIQSSKKEKFNFQGQQCKQDYDLVNRQTFKNKIKQYIQCPIMRANILITRNNIKKIQKIGSIQRYKNWEVPRNTQRFCAGDEIENTTQVILTHRSLNRINPQFQMRKIQKERRLLLELINYYNNENINIIN